MTAASFLLRRRPVPLKGGVSAHTVDAPDFRRMTASDIAFRDPLSEAHAEDADTTPIRRGGRDTRQGICAALEQDALARP